MRLAGARDQLAGGRDQDRRVVAQAVIDTVLGVGPLVERGVHEDAVGYCGLGSESKRRAVGEVFGVRSRTVATRGVGRVAQQRDLGQEHHTCALGGREGDAGPQ